MLIVVGRKNLFPLLILQRANGQIKSTGAWEVLSSKCKGLKKLNSERLTVGLASPAELLYIFQYFVSHDLTSSENFKTEKRRYNLNNQDKSLYSVISLITSRVDSNYNLLSNKEHLRETCISSYRGLVEYQVEYLLSLTEKGDLFMVS